MANDFNISGFNRLSISEDILFLESQFPAFEITRGQVRLTYLLGSLTLAVSKLVYHVLGKQPTTPYDDFVLAILERMEEPELKLIKRVRKELMNGVTKGSQSQKRDNSDPNPPLTDGDDSPSTIITPETEFDTEQSHTSKNFRLFLLISTL